MKEGRRLTAVHYNFVVIDLFQSTLAFSEELSCGSLPCYCCRYILLLFSESGHQDITGFNHRIAFILPLFCIYSDTRCNINGSTLLAG